MSDFIKLIAFGAFVWTIWLVAHIVAAIIGTALTLWVLYFFTKVITEEIEDDYEEN